MSDPWALSYAPRCHFDRWTLADASQWYADWFELVRAGGWLLSLGGSVLRAGHGHDLDVLLIGDLMADAYARFELPEMWDARWPVLYRDDSEAPGYLARIYALATPAHARLLDVTFLRAETV